MKRLLALVVVALFAVQPAYADAIRINLHYRLAGNRSPRPARGRRAGIFPVRLP
jgi:hypothetical protein